MLWQFQEERHLGRGSLLKEKREEDAEPLKNNLICEAQ